MRKIHNNNSNEKQEIFKWYGWGSPVGLAILIVGCALAVLLLTFSVKLILMK
ncbi:MAG: hypothetical protein LBS29_01630 [Endomicrobium sp.]|nr:hypothetical protein [Endomicrobium sp.]